MLEILINFLDLGIFASWPDLLWGQLWSSLNGHKHVHILAFGIFVNIGA